MTWRTARIRRLCRRQTVVSAPPRVRRPSSGAVAWVFWIGIVAQGALVSAAEPLRVGVGIADVTGEAAGVGMMGYGTLGQRTAGIHQRQWARAFVVADGEDDRRVAIVVADVGMIFESVHQAVTKRLAERFEGRYDERNVLLTATHTHSGPGGFSHSPFYDATTLGFQKKTFAAIVDGIVRSIERADASLAPGTVRVARGELWNASVNRSLEAYERNPEEERRRWGAEIDPEMTVLRFEQEGRPVGALTWFSSHAVSRTNENRLINPDHNGYASWLWERQETGGRPEDRGRFVAAFAQSNPGDMSPNLREGPDGRATYPHRDGIGPTDDEVENQRIIGTRQFEKARTLFAAAETDELTGPIDVRFRYVDFSGLVVEPRFADGEPRRTCPAAFGQSFTAGTEDGRGLSFIHEGDTKPDPWIRALSRLVAWPSDGLRKCHEPRILVVASGEKSPPWSPQILPVQLVRIGSFAIAAAPGEFTIMAGRRVRESVAAALGERVRHVVFAGYANSYAGYVVTPEEYEAQHYEAGFTHFGKWTQPAWTQELTRLAEAMRDEQVVPIDVRPPDVPDEGWSVNPGPFVDLAWPGATLGEVTVAPAAEYRRGEEVVVAFATGHPANDVRAEGTFLEIQQENADGAWTTVASDDDWSTSFHWQRVLGLFSTAEIRWRIPAETRPGRYRIVHHGDARSANGTLSPVMGRTVPFVVR